MAGQIEENEFEVYLGTSNALPADLVGEFLAEIGRLGKLKRNFGPSVVIAIEDVEVGSIRLRLKALMVVGIAMALVSDTIDVGRFVAEIVSQAEKPQSKLGRCISTMVRQHGVEELVVRTCDSIVTRSGGDLLATHDRTLEAYLPGNEEPSDESHKYPVMGMLSERRGLEAAVETGKRVKLAGRIRRSAEGLRFETMRGGSYRVGASSVNPQELPADRPMMIVATTQLIGDQLVLIIHQATELDDL